MFLKPKTLAALAGAGVLLGSSATAQEKIDFTTQIYPMIKGSCSQCHQPTYTDERGRSRKPKADLIVTNKEAFLKGGESGPVIVAGNWRESPFLLRALLPLDDDEHQPPVGKAPQWTKAEKELFEKWIMEGADFGAWTADPEPNKVPEWDGKEFPDDFVRTAK